jgi:hypothetical protein
VGCRGPSSAGQYSQRAGAMTVDSLVLGQTGSEARRLRASQRPVGISTLSDSGRRGSECPAADCRMSLMMGRVILLSAWLSSFSRPRSAASRQVAGEVFELLDAFDRDQDGPRPKTSPCRRHG